MRWLRLPPVAVAALLLGLVCAGPAVAQPDHLHLDLSLVGCGELKATAFELPKSAKLDLRFLNAANDEVLHQAAPTTAKDGSLELTAKVDLTAVRTVRLTVSRPGGKPFAFSEMSIPGECPLPFTGPTRWPTLAGTALVLVAAGLALVRVSAQRGHHAR
ncbi:MAG TPA: hypothetical protein VHM23_01795 [Actinomycetota bacterium]|jgi:hypothetical protein|nr:hypothetical protein [Actinomycetota bacterium]